MTMKLNYLSSSNTMLKAVYQDPIGSDTSIHMKALRTGNNGCIGTKPIGYCPVVNCCHSKPINRVLRTHYYILITVWSFGSLAQVQVHVQLVSLKGALGRSDFIVGRRHDAG